MVQRYVVLPQRGVALVSTDVHGSLDDHLAMERHFLFERTRDPETHWIILGDVVHAPDAESRKERPELYDYPDGSLQIIDRIAMCQRDHPGHVHFVLGNHDHGHVGGPHPHKFYDDEVIALENTLSPQQRTRLQQFLANALLAVVAPCGVLMCHGSPDVALTNLSVLNELHLDVRLCTVAQRRILQTLLTSYGQPNEISKQMLANVSAGAGLDLRVIVHGHDRDEEGFFYEGEHQLCLVLFGAPKQNKRYLRLDLGARYDGATALREDIEILRLFEHRARS